jgi:3',5'-cyclic AMP phosphodiesterase CpdA
MEGGITGGPSLPPSAWDSAVRGETTRIAHLTDVHFGATDPAVVAGLTQELSASPPNLVVISGDLTMGARHWEFRAARQFMDALPAPTLAVPGNHDITPYRLIERFVLPYARWHDEISAETEPVWMDKRVAVLGLNTARRMGPHLDWSRGRVTGFRLNRLVAKLDLVPPALVRIVVTHHPLLPPVGEVSKQIAGNAARALTLFAEHRVRLVLSGHLHRSYVRLCAPDLTPAGRPPLVLQGGSATSIRLRGEPNAYNRITVDATGAVHVEGRVWQGDRWAASLEQPVVMEA